MKLWKRRILPAILFGLAILLWIIPISVFGPQNYIARIFSYVFLAIFIAIMGFEFFSASRLKWHYILVLTLIYALSFIFPFESFQFLTDSSNHAYDSEYYYQLFKKIALDFYTFIIILVISIAFFITEICTTTNTTWTDRLVRLIIAFLTLYAINIASKCIQVFCVTNWKYWLIIFFVPISCDVFGFFGGLMFGHKLIKQGLAPTISPKKTWEGFFVAIVAGSCVSAGIIFGLDLFKDNIGAKVSTLLLSPIFAVLGDLYFSYIKRINGVKDYSKILLDHGGVLDRFDSLTFVGLLIFVVCCFSVAW